MQALMTIPEIVREYLKYNSDTGDVIWIKKPASKIKIGDKVTSIDAKGYYVVGFKNSNYKLHRIAWFLHTGEQPPKYLDHRDGNTINNKWDNLRGATMQENNRNKGRQKNNKSGFKGVCWHKKSNSWIAQASLNSKVTYLGIYSTPELAHQAYCDFISKHHKNFVNYG